MGVAMIRRGRSRRRLIGLNDNYPSALRCIRLISDTPGQHPILTT